MSLIQRTIARDYLDAIAESDITGHTAWAKIGYREASTSGVEVVMSPLFSATEYVFPTTPQAMRVVSTSTDDDGDPVGTGARTITIYYLDGSYVEKSTVVTMNGTSVVQTSASDIFRIQNVRLTTVGALNKTAGTITIKNTDGTDDVYTYGGISTGRTRQRQLVWTVPATKTLYVTNIAFSASNMGSTKYARFITKATYDDKAASVLAAEFFMPFNEIGLMNAPYNRNLKPPTRLPAQTDMKVTCVTNDTGAVLTCALRGWLE